jgi:hypothetical protein
MGCPAQGNAGQVTIGMSVILVARLRWPFRYQTYQRGNTCRNQLTKNSKPGCPNWTKKRSGDLIFKVGEKGGVSVYGLGRFPVTLYYEQWNRLLGAADDIKRFLEENKSRLKLKE